MNADRHHQQHHDDARRPQEPAPVPVRDEQIVGAPALATPLPAEPQTPAEGTFAVSQLAERLRLLELNLRAISSGEKPWAPPPSDLNLRSRTV